MAHIVQSLLQKKTYKARLVNMSYLLYRSCRRLFCLLHNGSIIRRIYNFKVCFPFAMHFSYLSCVVCTLVTIDASYLELATVSRARYSRQTSFLYLYLSQTKYPKYELSLTELSTCHVHRKDAS